jgi:hypothetical protein
MLSGGRVLRQRGSGGIGRHTIPGRSFAGNLQVSDSNACMFEFNYLPRVTAKQPVSLSERRMQKVGAKSGAVSAKSVV